MTPYVAYRVDAPERAAFIGTTVEEVGLAVAAQPNPNDFEILNSVNGFAAPLRPEDEAKLRTLMTNSPDGPRQGAAES